MLMRFDPLRELDRLVQRVAPAGGTGIFAMDARRHGDHLTVELDLPGVEPDSIDVTIDGDQLTVRAERRGQFPEGADVVANERPQGTFTRHFMLGDSVERDGLEATYDHGVLRLRIPVAQTPQPRRIEVEARRPELVA